MKAKFLAIAAFAAALSMSACSSKDQIATDTNVLPAKVMSVIKSNFNGVNVSQIKVDKDALEADKYDVVLANGTKIEFAADGTVTEVKAAAGDSVPSTFIPAAVRNYIATNYAGQKVVKIDIDKRDTEVKLSSGIELKFDPQGNFIKID